MNGPSVLASNSLSIFVSADNSDSVNLPRPGKPCLLITGPELVSLNAMSD